MRPAGMQVFAAFSKLFQKKILAVKTFVISLALLKEFSVSSVNLVQFAVEKLMKVRLFVFDFLKEAERHMVIGKWSEFNFLSTFQLEYGIKLEEAILISGAVNDWSVILVGWSSFMMPNSFPAMELTRSLPL